MSSAFQIVARSGPTAGSITALEGGEIFIGRDLNNDIVINDPEVSRRHAVLVLQGSNYALEDLGSTNGCMVNGRPLVGTYLLNPGDVITLGETIKLVYQAPEADHAAATMVAGLGDDSTIKSAPSSGDPFVGQQPPDQATLPDPFAGQPLSPMQAPADPYDQATMPDPFAGQPLNPMQAPADPFGGQPQGGYLDPFGGQPQGGYQDPYGGQQGGYAGQIPDQPSEPIEGKRKLPVILVVAIVLLLVVCICGIAGFIIDTLELYCPLGGSVINMIWPGSCP